MSDSFQPLKIEPYSKYRVLGGSQKMVRTTATMRSEAEQGSAPQLHPIDMGHLARQTMGDTGLEFEILRMFDQMAKVYYGRLEVSTNVSDLLMNLHALKGAAAGVGATSIARLAQVMETELKDGSPVNPEHIDDINMAVEEVSAFVASWLEREPPTDW